MALQRRQEKSPLAIESIDDRYGRSPCVVMPLRGMPRAASHIETDVLVPQNAQAAFCRCIGGQSRRGLRNSPRCTNGGEDRRSSITRRYGNYASRHGVDDVSLVSADRGALNVSCLIFWVRCRNAVLASLAEDRRIAVSTYAVDTSSPP
jgi:hypothetical protein